MDQCFPFKNNPSFILATFQIFEDYQLLLLRKTKSNYTLNILSENSFISEVPKYFGFLSFPSTCGTVVVDVLVSCTRHSARSFEGFEI